GVLPAIRHETAVDEQPVAVVQPERCIDVEAGLALISRQEVALVTVVEGASHPDRPVLLPGYSGISLQHRDEIDRRQGHALLDGGEQPLLPVQAPDLPGAETEQDGDADEAEHHGQPFARSCRCPFRPAHSPRSSLPSAALLAYCWANRTPL